MHTYDNISFLRNHETANVSPELSQIYRALLGGFEFIETKAKLIYVRFELFVALSDYLTPSPNKKPMSRVFSYMM